MKKEQLEKLITAKEIDQTVIPNLINLLKNDELKYYACRALANIITQLPTAIQTVRETLADSDPVTQYYLITTIGYAEANIEAFVPDLILFLSSKDDNIREIAANTLGEIKDLRSVPHLVRLMCHDPNKNVRYYSMHALCDIKDKGIITQLIALIQKENVETRMYAIHILGKMCQDAKEAIPYIFPYLQDNDEKMVAIAATALGNMGDQRARNILEKISKTPSPSFVLSARKALQNLKNGQP